MKDEQVTMEALAHAWDAGWDACGAKIQGILLTAATKGYRTALKEAQSAAPPLNPYRVNR